MPSTLARIIALLIFCLTAGPDARAAELNRETLDTIKDFAEEFCGEFWRGGSAQKLDLSGGAELKLKGLVQRLLDIGVEGAVNFSSEEYIGVIREDLAGELKDIRDCKERLWSDLRNAMVEPSAPRAAVPALEVVARASRGADSDANLEIRNTGGEIFNLEVEERTAINFYHGACGGSSASLYTIPVAGGYIPVSTGGRGTGVPEGVLVEINFWTQSMQRWLDTLAERLAILGRCSGDARTQITVELTYDDSAGVRHTRLYTAWQNFEPRAFLSSSPGYRPAAPEWRAINRGEWERLAQRPTGYLEIATQEFGSYDSAGVRREIERIARQIAAQ